MEPVIKYFKHMACETFSNKVDPGEVLGLIFAGYMPLASQSSHPIIVYSVANYRPHFSHFWENV